MNNTRRLRRKSSKKVPKYHLLVESRIRTNRSDSVLLNTFIPLSERLDNYGVIILIPFSVILDRFGLFWTDLGYFGPNWESQPRVDKLHSSERYCIDQNTFRYVKQRSMYPRTCVHSRAEREKRYRAENAVHPLNMVHGDDVIQ